jgi:hypothetical protein
MEARVAIGANRSFVLRNAVLLYGDGTTAFATLHPVVSKGNDQTPYLGPGQALTSAFLRTLAAELGARITPEILPTNVLARTPDMITWWTRARREVMFFGGADQKARELNGASEGAALQLPNVISLDLDLASVKVAKGSLDVPQVFKHHLGFSGTLVKVFGEVKVQRVQEFDILQFVQVQDELTNLLEAHLPSSFEKFDEFGFHLGSS